MRRFLITSPKFTGTAELIYNVSEILAKIDCIETDMSADTIKAFKRAVPSTIVDLLAGGNFSEGTVVVEGGYRISFDTFWEAYKKKINRQRALEVYNRLKDPETVACYNGIKPYDAYLKEVKVRQKLDPENYIKQHAWENQWQ